MKATLFRFTLMCPTKEAPRNFATICLEESLMVEFSVRVISFFNEEIRKMKLVRYVITHEKPKYILTKKRTCYISICKP